MKKLIIVLVLIGGGVGAGYAAGFFKQRALHHEALAVAEAATVQKVTEHKAAVEGKQKELDAAVKKEVDLKSQVTQLKSDIEEISGREPEVVEVEKWETEFIEVPVEVLVDRFVDRIVEADCLDCVMSFIDDLPPFVFKVSGVQAKLKTELGNHFVVGSVSLQDASVLGQGAKIVGTASFKKSLTEILQLNEKKKKRTLRQRIAATKVSEQFDWSLKYAFQITRRLSVIAGVLSGPQECLTATFDDYSDSLCRGGTIYEYGMSLSF